jgi:hypothetical protein
MMREYQVRICERLGVKFPGPTRQNLTWRAWRNSGPDFFVPRGSTGAMETHVSEFDCGSQIDVDRSKRRCIFVGWRPAIIGLKVFFVPCAGRLASPIFQRWMTLLIYRWIALPKALWFSNPCTASSFTAPRVMYRWNPNEPIPNALGTPTNSLNPFWISRTLMPANAHHPEFAV